MCKNVTFSLFHRKFENGLFWPKMVQNRPFSPKMPKNWGFLAFLAAVSSYIGGSVRRSVRPSNNVKNLDKSSNICPIDLNEVLFEFCGLRLSFERKKISKLFGGCPHGGKKGVKKPPFWGKIFCGKILIPCDLIKPKI